MNLIDKQNQKIKEENRLGLMTHVVAGYPNLEETRKIILMMVEQGVDFIEIQIPFSDPLGDGPTLRIANTKALETGVKVKDVFELVKNLRQKDGVKIPLLFMTYFNIVHHYGIEKFCFDASQIGINGLIIPDYIDEAEEYDHLRELVIKNNLYLIDFLSLDTSSKYTEKIGNKAKGFIYCFSQRGVTGTRDDMVEELGGHLNKIKSITDCPLAVGFGISKAEHVQDLRGKADTVIVGSAVIKAYNERGLNGAKEKVQEIVSALK
ncbi:tryptophan synthase subunit alpha [Candidatus Parcubacteria bacterium]|jgi:tryptophan synthase alpha chain|nr:tryptophan synthase subunit alpha [Candidatus Parcubacteria bacterium]MBT3948915.1 tryptophan synthase subunit alpha [Candidatus Parcubacteria bacterium]